MVRLIFLFVNNSRISAGFNDSLSWFLLLLQALSEFYLELEDHSLIPNPYLTTLLYCLPVPLHVTRFLQFKLRQYIT
jgi:hypothetical protein